MRVRATSKAAFLENELSGANYNKRQKIFEFILCNPGCTRQEIERGIPGMKINCVCGRVNELLKADEIHESGCKHDELSGRSVNRLYPGRKPVEVAA